MPTMSDAADGRVDRRGHHHPLDQAGRRQGRARRADLRDLDRQGGCGDPVPGRRRSGGDSRDNEGETVAVNQVVAVIETDADAARRRPPPKPCRSARRTEGDDRSGRGLVRRAGARPRRLRQPRLRPMAPSATARFARPSCAGSPREHGIDSRTDARQRRRRTRDQEGHPGLIEADAPAEAPPARRRQAVRASRRPHGRNASRCR